jgi:hypothetical protein
VNKVVVGCFIFVKEKEKMVRIARTPPPDPLTRMEQSVRRNEARDAQERERDALAALTAMEHEERTVAEGSGIGRSEQSLVTFEQDRPFHGEHPIYVCSRMIFWFVISLI